MNKVKQIEITIQELKDKGLTDLQIYYFLIKTEMLPESLDKWEKSVTLDVEHFSQLVKLLIKHVKVPEGEKNES